MFLHDDALQYLGDFCKCPLFCCTLLYYRPSFAIILMGKGELVALLVALSSWYKLQPSLSERAIVDGHGYHTALHFGVKAKENQDKVPTLYWLPKLHKKPYKTRFIANSSSCTTTELSKLLTSCLTAVIKHVIKYCEKVYERSGKNLFWFFKNSGEILDKFKARDFNATSLSTYDFSTLYTTLPHNLIKDTLIDLIERTFQREGSPYLACNDRNAFLLQKNLKYIMHSRVKMYVMR